MIIDTLLLSLGTSKHQYFVPVLIYSLATAENWICGQIAKLPLPRDEEGDEQYESQRICLQETQTWLHQFENFAPFGKDIR